MKNALRASLNAPERALILAAGVRSHLRSLTRPESPDPTPSQSHPDNALHNLGRAALKQVTIVVGYRKGAIQNACGSHFDGVAIKYVDSPVRIVPGATIRAG